MTTLKLYLEDSTLLEIAAVVKDVGMNEGRAWVRLDRTIFHPQGGGQKSDRGRIGGASVVHVAHASEGEVDHFVEVGTTFSIGQQVNLCVEPQFRAVSARNHSGGHLIAALVEARFKPLRAVAGHHWPGEARVEFEGETDLSEEVGKVLDDDMSRVILAGIPICVLGDPYSERTIQIGDYPPVPCGGTHLRSLSALQGIRIEKARMKSGKLRVSYSLST